MRQKEFFGIGEQLGDGFDSSTGEARTSAIETISKEVQHSLLETMKRNPIEDDCTLNIISSREELYSKLMEQSYLGGSATGNVHCITFYGSASQRNSVFGQYDIKADYTYILLEYRLGYNCYRIDNSMISLTPDAVECLRESGTEGFRRRYGDEFIIGFRHGAEYTALIEISNQSISDSQVDKETIRGEVAAALGVVRK